MLESYVDSDSDRDMARDGDSSDSQEFEDDDDDDDDDDDGNDYSSRCVFIVIFFIRSVFFSINSNNSVSLLRLHRLG